MSLIKLPINFPEFLANFNYTRNFILVPRRCKLINLITYEIPFVIYDSPNVGGSDEKGLENGSHVPVGRDDSVSDVHPAGGRLLFGVRAGRNWSRSVSWCKC